jgi:hypothetical protein
MPTRDYKDFYRIQDRFLSWWKELDLPFYLTGGTALGRFYLNHRYSEDLDFFTNANTKFSEHLSYLRRVIIKSFNINPAEILVTNDFARFFISDGSLRLKVDFVNDVEKYAGQKIPVYFGYVDNPLNILANKLSAIAGRDEAKDYFDLVLMANNYAFNWKEVFLIAKEKDLLNELELSEKLSEFRVEMLSDVDWLIHTIDLNILASQLEKLNDDFLLGKDNSLGINRPAINRIKTISSPAK